jgi:hypothetical protein
VDCDFIARDVPDDPIRETTAACISASCYFDFSWLEEKERWLGTTPETPMNL